MGDTNEKMSEVPNINLDGLEHCIVGKELETDTLVYSYEKILLNFVQDGMTYDEAIEFVDYNIIGLKPNGNFIIIYDDTQKI